MLILSPDRLQRNVREASEVQRRVGGLRRSRQARRNRGHGVRPQVTNNSGPRFLASGGEETAVPAADRTSGFELNPNLGSDILQCV